MVNFIKNLLLLNEMIFVVAINNWKLLRQLNNKILWYKKILFLKTELIGRGQTPYQNRWIITIGY